MRFKNRYYLLEIVWEPQGLASAASSAASLRLVDVGLQSAALQSALREAMSSAFGEWGMARVQQSLQVRYLNALTNMAIVRVARSEHRAMAALVAFMQQIKSRACMVKTIHVGGTIRSCQAHAMAWQKKRLAEMRDRLQAEDAGAQTTALRSALQSAAATNPLQKTPQQTLNQLATLLSQYNAAKQQQAAATSHAAVLAAAGPVKLARADHSVAATAESITAALDSIEKKGEEEIGAMES